MAITEQQHDDDDNARTIIGLNDTHDEGLAKKESPEYYIQLMKERNLTRSIGHMTKLFQNKGIFETLNAAQYRFRPKTASAGGLQLTEHWAYIHIWKSGGSTMTRQKTWEDKKTGNFDKLQSRPGNKLITFIREPIDHFLSGWSECMTRWRSNIKKAEEIFPFIQGMTNYSRGIHNYLNSTKQFATLPQNEDNFACCVHSFPQVNYLLNKRRRVIPSNLKFLGDIKEMEGLLGLIDFPYDNSKIGRNASTNVLKTKYFKSQKHMLRNDTLRAICEFVALDYYLLDYDLPDACRYSSYEETPFLHYLNLTENHDVL